MQKSLAVNYLALTEVSPISTATLANQPVSVVSTFTAVYISSISVAWGGNGNPKDVTTYKVLLSTSNDTPPDLNLADNVSFTTAPAGDNLAAMFTELDYNTTYYLYVRAVNHNNIGTDYEPLGSTRTLVAPPGVVISNI